MPNKEMAGPRRLSAGLLLFRGTGAALEVLLVHPGGPWFARKDEGHWSIPKGELGPGEEPLAAAVRETTEEIGIVASGDFVALGSIVQKGGKTVLAWACPWAESPVLSGDRSCFEMEWPPLSGRRARFPEVDRAQFFDLTEARIKIKAAQIPFIDRLVEHLGQA